jgi:hypothetical protein
MRLRREICVCNRICMQARDGYGIMHPWTVQSHPLVIHFIYHKLHCSQWENASLNTQQRPIRCSHTHTYTVLLQLATFCVRWSAFALGSASHGLTPPPLTQLIYLSFLSTFCFILSDAASMLFVLRFATINLPNGAATGQWYSCLSRCTHNFKCMRNWIGQCKMDYAQSTTRMHQSIIKNIALALQCVICGNVQNYKVLACNCVVLKEIILDFSTVTFPCCLFTCVYLET